MPKNPWSERMDVSGNQLVERVKEIAQDANARKVIVRDQQGKELVTVPLGWGAAGGMVTLFTAPWLAVLAAVGGAVAKVKIEVVRDGDPGDARDTGPVSDVQPGEMTEDETGDGMPIIHTDTPTWDAPPRDQT